MECKLKMAKEALGLHLCFRLTIWNVNFTAFIPSTPFILLF
ncbi:MAG: hypothetical protein E6029_03920 [Clostridioides difficile]|nr:hypothetical protein [Clostridioides difficile]EQJ69151.1 hypothetical protein QU3_1612 [Clostridioides difficile P42]EQK89274.1 hypothetical protein QSM_1523 [Clostridioides difficile P30]MDL0173731.1 hypothetical protein [Clostridioides difficile]MDU2057077.1 hypothetical protein [Clostridioides difficile]MDU4592818.1 hypothetical protein [Clostridioides difficile]